MLKREKICFFPPKFNNTDINEICSLSLYFVCLASYVSASFVILRVNFVVAIKNVDKMATLKKTYLKLLIITDD